MLARISSYLPSSSSSSSLRRDESPVCLYACNTKMRQRHTRVCTKKRERDPHLERFIRSDMLDMLAGSDLESPASSKIKACVQCMRLPYLVPARAHHAQDSAAEAAAEPVSKLAPVMRIAAKQASKGRATRCSPRPSRAGERARRIGRIGRSIAIGSLPMRSRVEGREPAGGGRSQLPPVPRRENRAQCQ